MKYCKTCGIKVTSPIKNCILCNESLQYYDNKESLDNYPKYKPRRELFKTFLRLVIITNVISILATLFLDFYTNGINLTWSLVVSLSNLYFILIFSLIYVKMRLFSKIILASFITVFYVFLMGFLLSNYAWAIDFIFPFVIIFNIMLLTLLLLIDNKKWVDYVTTLLLISILGILSILLVIFKVTTITWPTIVLALYSLSTILGLFFFSSKEVKEDFKRRFHY